MYYLFQRSFQQVQQLLRIIADNQSNLARCSRFLEFLRNNVDVDSLDHDIVDGNDLISSSHSLELRR